MKTLLNTSILIMLSGLVGYVIANNAEGLPELTFWEKEKVTPIDYRLLNDEVGQAILNAKTQAIKQGERELKLFHIELMQKVDNNFLDWYFNYGNQMMQNIKSTFISLWESDKEAQQNLQQSIAINFSNHVMPAPLIQAKLEVIAEHTINTFTHKLNVGLDHIPEKYNLAPSDWHKYLDNISIIVGGIEGKAAQPITLKTLVLGGTWATIATGALLAEMAMPAVNSALSSAGLSIGLGGRTGVLLEGSAFGGGMVWGIVAIAVISWEYFDHIETVEQNRPLLRQHINDYLQNFERDMLKPTGAIGAPIHQIESAIVHGLKGES